MIILSLKTNFTLEFIYRGSVFKITVLPKEKELVDAYAVETLEGKLIKSLYLVDDEKPAEEQERLLNDLLFVGTNFTLVFTYRGTLFNINVAPKKVGFWGSFINYFHGAPN